MERGGCNFSTTLRSICCGHPPCGLTQWMLLTQADIPVHQGISSLSTSRVQMAHSKRGRAADMLSLNQMHSRLLCHTKMCTCCRTFSRHILGLYGALQFDLSMKNYTDLARVIRLSHQCSLVTVPFVTQDDEAVKI